MNILHLIHDDKFFAFIDGVFSALPGVQNRFVAFAPGNAPTKHLEALTLWRRVDREYYRSQRAREDLDWCDCLVVHFLTPLGALMMRRAPRRVTVAWSGWGDDYLALLPAVERDLLLPETAALVERLRARPARRSLRQHAGSVLEFLVRNLIERPRLQSAVSRTDLFSAPIEEDYEFLRHALGPRFHARYAQLNYGSVERTFAVGPADHAGRDILVGNSATPTNNHAEVLRLLAKRDLGNRKVLVPLSYGYADYRQAILKLGSELLGDRFEPLTGFLPLAQYNTRIARCGCAIMNHRRQQALGNIGVALYRGARVYLDDASTLYHFFRTRGACVSAMSELEGGGESALDPLPPKEHAHNRALVESIWSDAAVRRNAAAFVTAAAARR